MNPLARDLSNVDPVRETSLPVMLEGAPSRVGEFTLKFGIRGACVGQWRTVEIRMRGGVVKVPARIERIQPDDGDGPGFTEFGIYDAFPVGTRVVAPWWN